MTSRVLDGYKPIRLAERKSALDLRREDASVARNFDREMGAPGRLLSTDVRRLEVAHQPIMEAGPFVSQFGGPTASIWVLFRAPPQSLRNLYTGEPRGRPIIAADITIMANMNLPQDRRYEQRGSPLAAICVPLSLLVWAGTMWLIWQLGDASKTAMLPWAVVGGLVGGGLGAIRSVASQSTKPEMWVVFRLFAGLGAAGIWLYVFEGSGSKPEFDPRCVSLGLGYIIYMIARDFSHSVLLAIAAKGSAQRRQTVPERRREVVVTRLAPGADARARPAAAAAQEVADPKNALTPSA